MLWLHRYLFHPVYAAAQVSIQHIYFVSFKPQHGVG